MLKRTLFFFISFIFLFTAFRATVHAAASHPAGTLIQSGRSIWRISDTGSARQIIESEEKFYSHRFTFANVVPANAVDLALPEETMLWGDGVLFNDNGTIYQISNGTKHGFVSLEVFRGQGFNFEMVRSGNLSALLPGTSITDKNARHLPGTLLHSQGTIWLQQETAKAFPTAAVFYSHGGSFTQTVPLNALDITSAEILSYRTGTVVNDRGAFWVVRAAQKMGFPSADCYLNFGFRFEQAISGNTAHLTSDGTVCGESSQTSAYNLRTVGNNMGSFQARVATFNLASGKIRVITDTAADRDCTSNCPAASLSAYAQVAAAQSGINGTYFCPPDYAPCAGQTNSFFWKVIDTKLNLMINRNNGLGEQDPFLAFDNLGTARYFKKWVDYQNSSFPAVAGINSIALVENNAVALDQAKLDDKQLNTKGIRGALGVKGQTLYLVHVLNATVPDTAAVLQTLGLDYAINLDGGGSAALMYNGAYKTRPGRNLPNALLVQELP